jgi:hypothetical protein
MKKITAFARLVRWPNLVFIVVTQCLFWYAVVKTKMPDSIAVFFLTIPFFIGACFCTDCCSGLYHQ